MASTVTISGTDSVGAVALAVSEMSVVVAGIVLQVALAADFSAASARFFLLRGSSSLGGLRFNFGC